MRSVWQAAVGSCRKSGGEEKFYVSILFVKTITECAVIGELFAFFSSKTWKQSCSRFGDKRLAQVPLFQSLSAVANSFTVQVFAGRELLFSLSLILAKSSLPPRSPDPDQCVGCTSQRRLQAPDECVD